MWLIVLGFLLGYSLRGYLAVLGEACRKENQKKNREAIDKLMLTLYS